MKMLRRTLALSLAMALASPALAQTADANWPSKPIKMIVPFAAGGGTDLVARALAEKLGAALGQTIIVDVETITPEAAEAYDVKGAPPLIAGEKQLTFTAIEGLEPPPVELAGADSSAD